MICYDVLFQMIPWWQEWGTTPVLFILGKCWLVAILLYDVSQLAAIPSSSGESLSSFCTLIRMCSFCSINIESPIWEAKLQLLVPSFLVTVALGLAHKLYLKPIFNFSVPGLLLNKVYLSFPHTTKSLKGWWSILSSCPQGSSEMFASTFYSKC